MTPKFDEKGLVPAIVIDAATGEVLTLAYMNDVALERTRRSGEAWFFSRSRQALWHKGETSGNTQRVVSVAEDCDGDALVVRVLPSGPACHRGTASCWDGARGGALSELDRLLEERAKAPPPESYTARLLADENLRIKKIGEESTELVHALLVGTGAKAAEEAADLLYHVAVALRAKGVPFSAVSRVLRERLESK